MTIEQAIQIGRQHQQAGRLADAEKIYGQILSQHPNHADALRSLGMLARQANRNDVAVALLRRAIAANPLDVESYNEFGIALSGQGLLDKAIAAFSHALRLKPDQAPIRFNLGTTLANAGRAEEAIAAYREALRLRPAYPTALNNLGNCLREMRRPDEAIAAYMRALGIAPDLYDAWNNLGATFAMTRRFDEAIVAYQRAIALKPDSPLTHYNLGIALADMGRLDEAIAAYSKSVELDPNRAEAVNNLGNALKDCGRLDDAMACFDRAIGLQPQHALFHSNRIFALHFHPAYDAATIHVEHRRWHQRHAARLGSMSSVALNSPTSNSLKRLVRIHDNQPVHDRRLRIGYVSADFFNHPVGRFLLPLLKQHDRQEFEIFCYADVRFPDQQTGLLRDCVDTWREITGLSDENVASLVREDRIDILVDLSMHSADNRLLVFARKPAPVQITWLAYCSTTGLETIDYRLTDPYFDPPELGDGHYSERSIRLPRTYWCFERPPEAPEPGPLPALRQGHVTFGCLNNFGKLSPPVVELWSRLLQRLPESRLLLHAKQGSHRQRLLDLLNQRGIQPSRVRFAAHLPVADYYRLYQQIDIGLDTFPCAGGTTTCDALWMGVPVVSLAGRIAVGRSGVSILSNVGLGECVARSEEQYIEIAVNLAKDLPRLSGKRAALRRQMKLSPLMDAPQFARDIEAAFRRAVREIVAISETA